LLIDQQKKIKMINFHFVIMDEVTDSRFPGFEMGKKLNSLPVWGNFNTEVLHQNMTFYSNPFKTAVIARPEEMKYFLELPGNVHILLGRTGNVIAPAWKAPAWKDVFEGVRRGEGITKMQVGGVPSDLYVLGKRELENILSMCGTGESFIPYLFDKVLFYNFEKIVEVEGYSFLIRHTGEYFRENLRITEYLQEEGFFSLYSRLSPVSTSKTTIGEEGSVKNSLIGNGAEIEGVVEDSVIFHGVIIKKGAVVKRSVILPSNCIERGVVIKNTLVLGGTRTIKEGSIIGDESDCENHDYPGIINKGLTVVGEGFNLPPESKIGAGCIVQGNKKEPQFPLEVGDTQTLVI